MTEKNSERIFEDLRNITEIADVDESQLLWLAGRLTESSFQAGEVLDVEGAPADRLYILVEGAIQLRRESDLQDTRVSLVKAPSITGKLPYSRLSRWPGTIRGFTDGRMLSANEGIFPEMVREAPVLVQRLVAIMSDRIRYSAREDQQRDKMAALGKLSAGLAHELNNPASAAKRAALALSEAQEALREATSRLDNRNLTSEQRKSITQFERQALQYVQALSPHDSLTQSEQEDEIVGWLEEHQVTDSWNLAPTLAEVNIDIQWLQRLYQAVGDEPLNDTLRRIVSQVLAKRLTKDIESSTGRISELVKAIKEYTYMDQAALQEIDIHPGIESTLVMLKYKLKHGIHTERIFDTSLPKICAYASELNQVWTNLIDNAADAMKDGGQLTVKTALDGNCAVVEIADTGSGIPLEIQDKIFDPFFTTKKMGEGTGLGLDVVWRIVHKHHGEVRVESKPGNTVFQVRLPLKQPAS